MSQVVLDILAQTKEANKSIDQFTKNAEKQANTVNKAFKALGVVAAGAVAVLAGRQVVRAIGNSIKAANEYEDSLQGLNTALKLAGTFSDEASKDFEQFATQIQRSTKFGDDAALSALQVATNFGLSGDRAKEFTQAAAELATVTGTSLDSAARQLGQTLTGQAGTLGRNIAGFRDLTAEQLKSGEAIDLLINRFGGAALAATKTYSGAVDQLEKAQGDLSKQFGFLITQNPIVIKGIELLGRGFAKAADFVEENRDTIIEFVNKGLRAVIRTIPTVVRVIGLLIKPIELVIRALNLWINTQARLLRALLDFEIVQKVINAFARAFRNTVSTFTRGVAQILDAVSRIPGAGRTFQALGLNIDESINSLLNLSFELSQDSPTNFSDTLIDGYDKIIAATDPATGAVNTYFKAINDGVDSVVGFSQRIADEFENASKAAERGFDTIAEKTGGVTQTISGDPTSPDFVGPPRPGEDPATEELKVIAKILGKELTVQDFGKGAGKFFEAVALGAEGARILVREGIVKAADAFAPGLGQVAGPIFDIATKDPEEIKALVEGFVDEIPVIIDALVEGLPVLIEALAEKADDIVMALILAIPKLAGALVESVGALITVIFRNAAREVFEPLERIFRNFGKGIQQFLDTFKELGGIFSGIGKVFQDLGQIFKPLVDGLKSFVDVIQGFIKRADPRKGILGEVFSGDFKSIGKRLGFASGLTEVPPGFPNDNFPANLTSGERVVDADTNRDLKQFLAKAGSGGSKQPIVVVLQVGQEELARTIVDLDRQGFQIRA